MGVVRFMDERTIEVETQACVALLIYFNKGFISLRLFDKSLSEIFALDVYDHYDSRLKLEKLINDGVGAEAEYLRLIQSFGTSESQAEYFDRFAKNQLTLNDLMKVVKKRRENYIKYIIAKHFKEVERKFRPVFEIAYSDHAFDRIKVLYGEVDGLRLALFISFAEIWLMGRIPVRPRYVFLFGEMGVALKECYGNPSKTSDQIAYGIFKSIVESDSRDLELLCRELRDEDPKYFLDLLKKAERDSRLFILDNDLYNYIKSLIAMNAIVGN
jgi:hypothetical protein